MNRWIRDTFTDTGTVVIPPFVWDEEDMQPHVAILLWFGDGSGEIVDHRLSVGDSNNFELFDLVERLNLPGQGLLFTAPEEVGFSVAPFTCGTGG